VERLDKRQPVVNIAVLLAYRRICVDPDRLWGCHDGASGVGADGVVGP
jgi:hypothetical protein